MGWFTRKKPTKAVAAHAQVSDLDALAAARYAYREAARERIRSGFVADRDALVDDIVGLIDDVDVPDGRARVEAAAAVADEWTARLEEQATWTEPGDYSRVQAAFDELAAEGIVGRMNFTCCQTCGTDEIDDERTPLGPGEQPVRPNYPFREWGYTFFHQQDAESLGEEPAVLYLSYSCFLPAPSVDAQLVDLMLTGDEGARGAVVRESDLAVGRRVVAALQRQGLTVDWPEDTSTRIRILDVLWRMPLPD